MSPALRYLFRATFAAVVGQKSSREMVDYREKWGEVTGLNVDGQVKFFLRAFVLEFQGKFEPVLDIANEFKNYAEAGERETISELDEFHCHLFLEKRGETLTVRALRENLLAELRLAPHHNPAFIEYLLFRYKKTLAELFAPPPVGGFPQHLLEALDRAIDAYNQTKEAERQRQAEIERLAEAEKNSRNELERHTTSKQKEELAGQEFSGAFAALKAKRAKREAEEALAKAEKIDPYEEEQKRLAAEQLKKEQEEQSKRDASRAKLKARAALWQ